MKLEYPKNLSNLIVNLITILLNQRQQNHCLSYKPRINLNMYERNQQESTFIEVISSKRSNIIVGCVYKYSNIDLLNFKTLIKQLLDKILKEQKQICLLGDFNINLLNYNEHQPTNVCLVSLASNTIILYIL